MILSYLVCGIISDGLAKSALARLNRIDVATQKNVIFSLMPNEQSQMHFHEPQTPLIQGFELFLT